MAHGPATKSTLHDFLVVQDHHVFVSWVFDDMAIQSVHLVTATFNGLQINATTKTQDARDAICNVVLARGVQNRFSFLSRFGVHRAAHIQQTNEHDINL